MADCNNCETRLTVLEVRVKEHSKVLANQTEKNNQQIELNTLLKMQIDNNKEQNEQLKRFDTTLMLVNENLTKLNINQDHLNVSHLGLSNRVNEIEGILNGQNIEIIPAIKKWIGWIFKTIGAVVLAYILIKLRLN